MYMWDTMHQVDLGVIISFFKAILRNCLECVGNILHIPVAGDALAIFLFLFIRYKAELVEFAFPRKAVHKVP